MSSPKLQSKEPEDSIFLECILFLDVKLAKILFPRQKIQTSNVISYSHRLKMSLVIVE